MAKPNTPEDEPTQYADLPRVEIRRWLDDGSSEHVCWLSENDTVTDRAARELVGEVFKADLEARQS